MDASFEALLGIDRGVDLMTAANDMSGLKAEYSGAERRSASATAKSASNPEPDVRAAGPNIGARPDGVIGFGDNRGFGQQHE